MGAGCRVWVWGMERGTPGARVGFWGGGCTACALCSRHDRRGQPAHAGVRDMTGGDSPRTLVFETRQTGTARAR
eukprot:258475-Chlamydomonas_euryale.AAC.1